MFRVSIIPCALSKFSFATLLISSNNSFLMFIIFSPFIFFESFPLLSVYIIHYISLIFNSQYARTLLYFFVHIVHLFSCLFFAIISSGGDILKLCYKIDVLAALRSAGFSSYRLRKDSLFSESTIQKFRRGEGVGWENIEILCNLLSCQPADIIEMK